MFDVIIAASGQSSRFGAEKNKLLASLNGSTVLENSVRAFLGLEGLERVILAVSDEIYPEAAEMAKRLSDNIKLCIGGATRTDTVKNALSLVKADTVLIHDGARPFISYEVIQNVLTALKTHEAAVPVIPVIDSLTDISAGYKPVERANFRAVQTPQGFQTKLIKSAYYALDKSYSDDVSVYLTMYNDVATVSGDYQNIKITSSYDILIPCCRVGVGFDTHRLMTGRRLVLGGVTVPNDKGLFGHSDADVLTHAVMDALLSAAGKRDIGFYFPDTSSEYKDIDSFVLLKRVLDIVKQSGYKVYNVAATVMAQQPKLSPFIPLMISNFAAAFEIPESNVSVLATTTEGVGEVGREEAISAMATATIIQL